MTVIKRGVIKSFDPATYKATVQVEGSLFAWLADVPVAKHLGSGEVVAEARCGIIFFDESNPADACIFAIYEGVPAENIDNHSDRHAAGGADSIDQLLHPKALIGGSIPNGQITYDAYGRPSTIKELVAGSSYHKVTISYYGSGDDRVNTVVHEYPEGTAIATFTAQWSGTAPDYYLSGFVKS